MIQRGDGARLALESPESIGIVRECRRKNLDRDVAAETRIVREIDFAHPARSKRRDNFVGAERRSRSERQGSGAAPILPGLEIVFRQRLG